MRAIFRDELSFMLKSDRFIFQRTLQIGDAIDVILGRTIGTRFGNAADQKAGFFGATPVVQQTAYPSTASLYAALSALGLVSASAAAAPSLGATGAVTLDPTLGNVFKITPTNNVQLTASVFPVGAIITIVVLTSGTTSYTIDFQTGFTVVGTLSTGTLSGRYFTITFASDGVNFRELCRTAAMLPS